MRAPFKPQPDAPEQSEAEPVPTREEEAASLEKEGHPIAAALCRLAASRSSSDPGPPPVLPAGAILELMDPADRHRLMASLRAVIERSAAAPRATTEAGLSRVVSSAERTLADLEAADVNEPNDQLLKQEKRHG